MARRPERFPSLGVALTYAAFVVYGSLVPLAFRARPLADAWAAFLDTPYLQLGMGSRADWVANILLYIPLAFLLAGSLSRRRGWSAGVLTFCLCATLAIAVEFSQLFFPPRTVSLNDLLAECIGAALGIALWRLKGGRLLELWNDVLSGGPQGKRALIVLYSAAYLAFSLFPYDFIVSGAELAQKLASPGRSAVFVTGSCGGTFACGTKLLAEVLTIAPLGAFLGMLAGSTRSLTLARAALWGMLLGLVIEGLQTFLASGVSQGASILTRGIGMAFGLAVYRSFRREWLLQYRARLKVAVLLALPLYLALLLALNGFFSSRLANAWAAYAKLREVRFMPFYYHYFTSETQAMYSLLVHAGAYAPIGVMAWILGDRTGGRAPVWSSAFAAFAAALAMEALKLFLVGKRPDPTNALIGAAAAAFACFAVTRLAHWQAAAPRAQHVPAQPAMPRRKGLLAAGAAAALLALGGWMVAVQPREHFADETRMGRLPAPETLSPPALPRFRTAHPRLPTPSAADLAVLRAQNPGYLRAVRDRADGGRGDLYSATLQELIEPGSVDLGLLHRRLMELRFSWRGHNEGRALALAYDWLHGHWSSAQRAELRGKLAEACLYLIEYIRSERLSPYNVILYNSPLQALMAASIALYGDDPRGDGIMAFTLDLWKNRVLPAWRQVMGRNGGWHEGGEYVGIGIGKAIHQLPALWRHATGEDLFASEPGIRGFLDFLVYRTQPDGAHFRWGDAAWLDRVVPDAAPLALELRHAAAYSLNRSPKPPVPSAWPWGPLTDASLLDPRAAQQLPLSKHFDGLGLVVARSDWSPDATYVTFKAGDNYWSHSHLDQGAFTIFKGGPLAIDSGVYGPHYGSDHHMNYTYQTIAHNTVTVTDPQDTVPAPGPKGFRPIANDGGQRRVGSGWGVEPAPLDRAEWEAKRDTYHTGALEDLLDRDDLTVALADVTPAYTNRRSGEKTFSHRTRRVERYWRVFGYDRADDVVVIFDQVVATRASFRKRWLLHTVEQPHVVPGGFSVGIAPEPRAGRAGGRLEARVLLPRQALVNPIGGRGFEFFVGERNYDEGGKLRELIQNLDDDQGEPGAWRIELSPRDDAAEDLFLVVLLPTSGAPAPHRVQLVEAGGRVGCEIAGPKRTTRWWFEPGLNRAEVEVLAGGESRRYRLEGRSSAPPSSRGWLDRLSEKS
jgi:VanZ family protein